MSRLRIAILFYRIGPYHSARLQSAAEVMQVTAVEYSNVDPFYAWDEYEAAGDYEFERLFYQEPVETQTNADIRHRVGDVLAAIDPQVVAIPGWHDRCSLAALRWCRSTGVPTVMMSETTPWDFVRRGWKEAIKRAVVRQCSAGLVGGRSHADYLAQLGLARERVFYGYDVVDNGYFAAAAAKWRSGRSEDGGRRAAVGEPEQAGVPSSIHDPQSAILDPRPALRSLGEAGSTIPYPKYFLSSNRFIEKKNLFRLLDAYAGYVKSGGESVISYQLSVEEGHGQLGREVDVETTGGSPNTVRIGGAGMERKNGGGQDARATVVRASCPEPSIAIQQAKRTVLGGPPVPLLMQRRSAQAPQTTDNGSILRSLGGAGQQTTLPWPLVLLGDGELKAQLVAHCENLGLRVIQSAPWEALGEIRNAERVERESPPSSGLRRLIYPGKAERGRTSDLCHLPPVPGPLSLGTVFFPGFRQYDELPRFYAHAGAFVHASTTEQWGLVVNEAIASGLPVLVSDRCGCAADLVEQGVNGYVFDPLNVTELAGLLGAVAAADFPLSEFGAASRDVAGRFDISSFGLGMKQATEAALAQPARRFHWHERVFLRWMGRVIKRVEPKGSVATATKEFMWVFRFLGKKVMALPAEPKALPVLAMARYQAHTLRRRCYRTIISAALRSGTARVVARQVPLPAFATLGLDYDRWMDLFREKLGRKELHAAVMWPTQPQRRRLYFHLFDADLDCVGFVKIGLRGQDVLAMETGFYALSELRQLPLQRVRLPKPLGYGMLNGAGFLIIEPLPQGAHVPAWNRDTTVRHVIEEYGFDQTLVAAEDIRALGWWQRYAASVPRGADKFHQTLLARLADGAVLCRVHGDMGLSNIVETDRQIWLFDWENTDPAGPYLTDSLGYFLSFSVGKVASHPRPHLRALASRFLEGADSRRVLDVMLALAYRHACGLPDAAMYMRHWSQIDQPNSDE